MSETKNPSKSLLDSDVSPTTIAFIGCGAVGRCLGKLFKDAGFFIAGICCKTPGSAESACRFIGSGTPVDPNGAAQAAASASLVIVATPDGEIPIAEAKAAPGLNPGSTVIHLSGALPSSILKESKARGAAVGSMHPLQSFPDPSTALSIVKGSFFACEGDEAAVSLSFALAGSIEGIPIRIETSSKSIYHAAAAAASNFLIVPLLLASDLMREAGIERVTGLKALMPLIEGTVRNTAKVGVPNALTGPIERGDEVVVKGHLSAIDRICPAFKPGYVQLARLTVDAARRKGTLDTEEAERIINLLEDSSRGD